MTPLWPIGPPDGQPVGRCETFARLSPARSTGFEPLTFGSVDARIHGLSALLSDISLAQVLPDNLRIAQLGTRLGTPFANGSLPG